MSIQHHPDDLLLATYAAGTLDGGISLVVATHLSFCATCRTTVRQCEQIGGVLLNDLTPEPMAADALAKTLARLDRPYEPENVAASNDDTPIPLRRYMNGDLAHVRWRKLGPHLEHATLHRRGPLSVRLLRGAPGINVGLHTHKGAEYTLALHGGYTDATGTYGPGDFQVASDDIKHDPTVDADGTCTILAVTTDRLRFDGWIPRLLARLFGF